VEVAEDGGAGGERDRGRRWREGCGREIVLALREMAKGCLWDEKGEPGTCNLACGVSNKFFVKK